MEQSGEPAVMPLAGYLDRISGRAGDRVAVKVSAQRQGHFEASLLRIRHADPNPAGPGIKMEEVAADFAGSYRARFQAIDLGSYARIPAHPAFTGPRLVAGLLVQPWLLRDQPSVLMASHDASGHGWSLEISARGLRFCYDAGGDRRELLLDATLHRRQWYRVWGGFDVASGALLLGLCPLQGEPLWREETGQLQPLPSSGELSLAAAVRDGLSHGHFNGRLEDPALYDSWPREGLPPADPEQASTSPALAWWDFSRDIDTQAIIDRGPHGLHGRLVNVPTRAVCGARWTGEELCWPHTPRHYAAIHFHEDDLYDCGWDTDFEFTVPAGLRSGVYAIRLRQGQDEDILPFYVLPPKGRKTARVCFLASTFTYQAYANHARDSCDAAMRERIAAWGAAAHNPDDYPIYGRSTYNFHPDGSGHAYSSRLRPVLTWRPGFLTFVDARGSGLRHFSADSHLTDWLEAKDIAFDVVTDEDLDAEGVELIRRYEVVLTASHPEYHTLGTLDALAQYTASGGHLVYLGGNGFYWRVARSPALPGLIEVRRAEGGIRAWAAEAGESYHALDGSYGGLWRRNGRPPQRLVGVGFSAQGLFEGAYYRRLPDSHRPEVSWIFEGVTEEKLGDYGLSGGGAAGFELDRADEELGTPPNALVLARSEGHSSNFVAVPEELLSHIRTVSGEPPEALIRGELVYFQTAGGGAVFSVGSITFCGSLSHAGYDNDISRLLENVVRRFASEDRG